MGRNSKEIIEKALSEGRLNLLEPEAKAICMDYGIPTPEFSVASTKDEAVKAAEKLGYPIVLKIVSPDILHKTEAGGVIVGLNNSEEVGKAYDRIIENSRRYRADAQIRGVLIQKMAPQGTEIIVGGLKDPQFGQTLMFGLGGVFVEILKDVTFRVAPIDESDAKAMISEIKAYPILKGYRGKPPVDEAAIIKILLAASNLLMDLPEINQMDLNPIMAYDKGASVVDARILLEKV
ncbi:MAG: acetate--CoA ligase family protein [Candidatus Bathyarchaeia archaeon]